MGINPILRALVAALPLAAIALPALAEINDYEFQLTQSESDVDRPGANRIIWDIPKHRIRWM